MRPLQKLLIALGILLVIGLTICSAIKLANLQSHSSDEARQKCQSVDAQVHKVAIQNGKVRPVKTVAPLCDKLSITNYDDQDRLTAFGQHEKHETYDGVSEILLAKGQNLTVTLVQTGNFRFHDHIHDEIQGTFTVVAN